VCQVLHRTEQLHSLDACHFEGEPEA
jgi:hypothetical protein